MKQWNTESSWRTGRCTAVSDNLVSDLCKHNKKKMKEKNDKCDYVETYFLIPKKVLTERIKWENISNTYNKRWTSLIHKRF